MCKYNTQPSVSIDCRYWVMFVSIQLVIWSRPVGDNDAGCISISWSGERRAAAADQEGRTTGQASVLHRWAVSPITVVTLSCRYATLCVVHCDVFYIAMRWCVHVGTVTQTRDRHSLHLLFNWRICWSRFRCTHISYRSQTSPLLQV